MRIAVQMDHILSINIHKDTTFALLLEAQNRGYDLYHYVPNDLSYREGKIIAQGEKLSVFNNEDKHFHLSERQSIDLSTMDVVLLRQDPPFDMHYITTTFLLDLLPPQTLVINNPSWVRNSPEKLFVLEFQDLMPETVITRNKDEVLSFYQKHGHIIVKPLYGNGGAGVFYFKPNDANIHSLFELFSLHYNEFFIVQRYLPEVEKGDKRIILLEGEAVGAVNRLPNKGDYRSNLHVGGNAISTELTNREKEICQRLAPYLKERGLFFVGIDVIGGFLTEINVTSPTTVQEIRNLGGHDIALLFWDKILNLCLIKNS